MTSVTELRVEDYFVGRTHANGLVEDRFGKVRRRFVVDIDGRVEGDTVVLEETFHFDNGEVSHRTWRIRPTGQDTYTGTAGDVVGTAQGRVDGNVLHWAYDLRLKIGGREMVIGFDDRMYLGEDGVLLNIARMHKWGVTIGRITIAFTREAEAPASRAA